MATQTDTITHFNDTLNAATAVLKPVPDSESNIIHSSESLLKDSLESSNTLSRFVTSTKNNKTEIQPILKPNIQVAWLTIVLIGCLLILAIVRFSGKITMRNLFQPLTSTKHETQSNIPAGFRVLLFLFSVLVYAAFIMLALEKFKFHEFNTYINSYGYFWTLTGIISGFFFLQFLLVRLSGFIFKTRDLSKKYTSSIFAFNAIGGILVLPILLVSVYDSSLISIYLAAAIIALLFIFRIIRGTSITLVELKHPLYHFFIYFCTLEILPILIIIKTIIIVNQL